MRVGLTSRLVYVAPKERGVKNRGSALRRPNLADLLMRKALEPALAATTPAVVAKLERALDEIGRRNGF